MKFELGPGLKCDLQKLIVTRALVQANSGGGKSWALRRLLEQTHGRVQQIVLDPEGEFSSLREKFDYVLAARQGGDTVADPRSAKLLAERLLELRVSAICDIYELKAPARITFVKHFLEAMIDAPKALWHPVLVVVDEAHTFCPQKGEAESAAAVIDLATRGRKRGFCAVLATQRLSKLHKDAAAELNNKLIGRTSLDVDRARAAEELGFSTKEQSLSLRQLEPGHWFAFGPALSANVVEAKLGPVQTTHPEAGARIAFEAPPATDKIKALLPKLADLPAEAEKKQRTEAELKKDLAAARATITRLERAALHVEPKTETKVERVVVPMLTEDHLNDLKAVAANLQSTFANARGVMERMLEERGHLAHALTAIDRAIAQATKPAQMARPLPRGRLLQAEFKTSVRGLPPPHEPPVDGDFRPGASQQRILNALRWLETVGVNEGDKSQVALLAEQSPTSGGYFNNLGALRTAGLIDYPRAGVLRLTEAGRAIADPGNVPDTSEGLHQILFAKLGSTKAAILKALIAVYPEALTKAELAERAGELLGKPMSATSGGYFNNLGSLRSLKLIDYPQPGTVVALPVLFLEGAA